MDVPEVRLVLEDCFGHGIGAPVRVAVSGPTLTREQRVEVQRELTLVGLTPGEYHIKIEPEYYEPLEGRFVLRDGAITEAHDAFTIPTSQVAGIDALDYGA
jgi:hypothetical protein